MASAEQPCVLCSAPSVDAIPTASADYAVCGECGLVRRTGQPTTTAPAEEASAWRRASTALRLGRLEANMKVLVVDGGRGLCAALEDIIGVRATDYPPGDAPLASFDCVVMYDRLERVGEPRELLARALRWLRPGGRVVVETSNLARPDGPLTEGLLDGSRAHVFDATTLRELLGRGGVHVERLDDDARILAAGIYRPGPTRAAPTTRRGARIAACLDGYRHLERVRRAILVSGSPREHLGALATLLERPTFDAHATRVVRELEHILGRVGAYRMSLAVCEAVLAGDTSSLLRQHCRRSAFIYRAKLGMAEPLHAVIPAA